MVKAELRAFNSALAVNLTTPITADADYFRFNGGHVSRIANEYIVNIDISIIKPIGANYQPESGNGYGPRFIDGLPFRWKYDFKFPAILQTNNAIIVQACKGESSLRLNGLNPAFKSEDRFVANFSFPDNYVS